MEAKGIKVAEFVQAREKEVSGMKKILDSSTSNRRVFQTLPRNMRRRAMSHNIKRLPVRLRLAASRELREVATKAPDKSKCRRRRRQKKNIMEEFGKRKPGSQWLETHLWHAKRMHMVSLWGYKLAWKPTTKGFRDAYRATANHSVLHDASYYRCVEVSSGEVTGEEEGCRGKERGGLTKEDQLEAVEELIGGFCTKESRSCLRGEDFLSGQREGTVILQLKDTNNSLLGPAQFLWNKNLGKVWIWIHPSFYEKFIEALKAAVGHGKGKRKAKALVPLSVKTIELLRFEIRGPKAREAIRNVCKGTESSSCWRGIFESSNMCALSSGSVIGTSVHDPRLLFPLRKHRCNDAVAVEDMNAILREWKNLDAHKCSAIWNASVRKSCSESKVHEKEINKRREEAADCVQLTPTESDSVIPVLLVFFSGANSSSWRKKGPGMGFGDGWDIIIPSGWGKEFFRALTFAGCRVGGQRERHSLKTEMGLASFPEDFPDSISYSNFIAGHVESEMSKYEKKPPAKRINYNTLGVAFPFDPPFGKLCEFYSSVRNIDEFLLAGKGMYDFSKLNALSGDHSARVLRDRLLLSKLKSCFYNINSNDGREMLKKLGETHGSLLVQVSMEMVNKGTPEMNSMICFPCEGDFANSDVSEPQHCGGDIFSPSSSECNFLQGLDTSRRIIGFCTSSGYLYSHSCGAGFAFCNLKCLVALRLKYPKTKLCKALVRASTSPQYRLATLSVVV